MTVPILVTGAALLGLAFGRLATVAIRRWSAALAESSDLPDPPDTAPGAIPAGLIEVVTAGLFAAAAAVWGWHGFLPVALALLWACVVTTAIDLRLHRIPNRLTLRLPLVLAPLLVVASAITGDWWALGRAAIAGVAVPAVMLALSELFRLLRGQSGMGMGDVKLGISLGLGIGWLGAAELVAFGYLAVATAAVVGIILLVARRRQAASRIAFGPYLALATVAVLLSDRPATFVRGLLGA